MEVEKKNYFKFVLTLILCLLLRLIPFRLPNFEPILATQMPFSKAYGPFLGFIFGFLSIVSYDFLTHTLGMWTLVTATTYGVLGLFSFWYLRNREAKVLNFVSIAVVGTLFFDTVTGLVMGPILFHQSFYVALVGQIPFTVSHLLGNVILSTILSPAVYRFILKKKREPRLVSIINPLNPKII